MREGPGLGFGPLAQRQQVHALSLEGRGGCAGEGGQRPGHVGERRGGRARLSRRDAGTLQEADDVDGALEEEDAVGGLAVVPQALAVIGEDGDHGVGRQRLQEPADLRVHVGHRTVVGGVLRAPGEGRWRVVGEVGVEVVHEEEERPLARSLELGDGPVRHLVPRSGDGLAQGVVVDREPLGQAVLAVQHRRRHDGGGGVAPGRHDLGQRGDARGEGAEAVVLSPVSSGNAPVRTVAWEGRVRGAGAKHRVKEDPLAARALRFGVRSAGPPQGARRSARKVSRLTSTTLGLCDLVAIAEDTARTSPNRARRKVMGPPFSEGGYHRPSPAPGHGRPHFPGVPSTALSSSFTMP